MLSIAIKSRATLALLGYVKLSPDHTKAQRVADCTKAAHFRGALAAAQVRERFQPAFDDLLAVEECHCVEGLALNHQLFPVAPWG